MIRRISPQFDFGMREGEQKKYEQMQTERYLAMTLTEVARDIALSETPFPITLQIELRENNGTFLFDCRVKSA